MAYDPTSRGMLPVFHVRELIARSSTWQTWTGAGSTAAARAFVHYELVQAPANNTPPYAIVGLEDGSQGSEIRARGDHEIRGAVRIRFIGDVNEALDLDEQLFTFADLVDTVKEEMIADADTYGFRLLGIDLAEKPMFAPIEDKKSRGVYAFANYSVRFWD